MTTVKREIPVPVIQLFPLLDTMLVDLLRSLNNEEWHSPTIAKLWTVKDIAAHLLDGNLRTLSFSRDNYFGESAPAIHSYAELVTYLNQLNMTWANATKRLSPKLLTDMLVSTGKQYHEHLKTLDPFDKAIFSVAWAGQQESENWFHIAREYTEKFLHQQQIRDAVGKQALFTKELFYPFIDTLMYGLPYTYRDVQAGTGTIITVKILTEIGGEWHIRKMTDNWELIKTIDQPAAAIISMQPGIAWKLFSKGISPGEAVNYVEISGEKNLGTVALQMVSVMA